MSNTLGQKEKCGGTFAKLILKINLKRICKINFEIMPHKNNEWVLHVSVAQNNVTH